MRARPSAFGMPVSRTAGGKQNALKEGALGYNLPNKNSVTFWKSIAFQEGFAIIWKSHKEKPPSQTVDKKLFSPRRGENSPFRK